MARNSTTFQKGQSGNPNGRPASYGYVKRRREFLSVLMDTCEPNWEELVRKQLEDALNGNQHAMRIIFDHVLPKQAAVSSDDEENLFENLTEEENEKLYEFIAGIIPKDEIITFVDKAKKVTSFVQEIKARRMLIS